MRRALFLLGLACAACGPVEVGKLELVLRKGSADPFTDPGDGVTSSRPVAALRLTWDSPLVRWPADAGSITLPLTASASAAVDLPAPAEPARLTVEGLMTGTEELWSLGRSARIAPPSGQTPTRVTVLLGVADGWTAVAESGGTRLAPAIARLGTTGAVILGGGTMTLDGGVRPSASGGQLYETATSAVSTVAVTPVTGASAVTLASGAVLYGFGRTASGSLSAQVWLIDPTGVAREVTVNGAPLEARTDAALLALADGTVLVIGGEGVSAPLATVSRLTVDEGAAQVTVNTFATMPTGRARAAAVQLNTGEVIVVGGEGTNGVAFDDAISVEPDASSPAWRPSGNRMIAGRVAPKLVRLEDDSVLVWGGGPSTGDVFSLLVSADGVFLRLAGTTPGLTTDAVPLRVGRSVLFVGGEDGVAAPFAARFVPTVQRPMVGQQYAGAWSRVKNPAETRRAAALVRLDDGAVLVAGGTAQRLELFTPSDAFIAGD